MMIWAANSFITLFVVLRPLMDRYLKSEYNRDNWFWRERDTVETVYRYHEGWYLDTWLGFKHWFYPWKEPK